VRGLWLIEQQVDGGCRQDNGTAGAGRGGWPRLCPAGPFTFGGPLERRVMCTSAKEMRLCFALALRHSIEKNAILYVIKLKLS